MSLNNIGGTTSNKQAKQYRNGTDIHSGNHAIMNNNWMNSYIEQCEINNTTDNMNFSNTAGAVVDYNSSGPLKASNS